MGCGRMELGVPSWWLLPCWTHTVLRLDSCSRIVTASKNGKGWGAAVADTELAVRHRIGVTNPRLYLAGSKVRRVGSGLLTLHPTSSPLVKSRPLRGWACQIRVTPWGLHTAIRSGGTALARRVWVTLVDFATPPGSATVA